MLDLCEEVLSHFGTGEELELSLPVEFLTLPGGVFGGIGGRRCTIRGRGRRRTAVVEGAHEELDFLLVLHAIGVLAALRVAPYD